MTSMVAQPVYLRDAQGWPLADRGVDMPRAARVGRTASTPALRIRTVSGGPRPTSSATPSAPGCAPGPWNGDGAAPPTFPPPKHRNQGLSSSSMAIWILRWAIAPHAIPACDIPVVLGDSVPDNLESTALRAQFRLGRFEDKALVIDIARGRLIDHSLANK